MEISIYFIENISCYTKIIYPQFLFHDPTELIDICWENFRLIVLVISNLMFLMKIDLESDNEKMIVFQRY